MNMSKRAEEKAWKAYPYQNGMKGLICENSRKIFIEGYSQAEKDLGWISVKDRVPDTTAYVFTCIEMNGIPQCVGFHYYKDGKWFEGFEEDTVGAVEYWMPIPQLPKEGEK